MSLKLMYITNKPDVALLAQEAGVDRIWIDLEYIGKAERQGGMDTVKSDHSTDDILLIKPLLNKSELLVRVNPIHEKTKEEIETVVKNGADVIMLPMFRTKKEVEEFVRYVNGRAKTLLLVETKDALENIEEILSVPGIDEAHIGLNDLHLEYNKKFMFELLVDGTVKELSSKIKKFNIPFGIGGIARVGLGMVPSEYIIGEHYNLGSSAAILSRSFCDANIVEDISPIKDLFIDGVKDIKKKEDTIKGYSEIDYEKNYKELKKRVKEVVKLKGV